MPGWSKLLEHIINSISASVRTIWCIAEKKALERESHAMKRWERYQQNMQSASIADNEQK